MIEKRYYTSDTLHRALLVYEERYGMESAAFYAAHVDDLPSVDPLPGFHRHVWASMYREWHELEDDGLPGRVSRELERV